MSTKPNILLITSDQQHWSTLGFVNPEIRTPNLDQLSAHGMAFNRAYCPNPTCTPTRASMITGKYPSQHGAWALGTKLPETEFTMGDAFQAAGYRTALVGKAHFHPLSGTEEYPSLESYPIMQDLDFWRDFDGPFYGFDHVELARNHTDEPHVGQHYALWMESKGCTNWRDYFRPPTGNTEKQRWTWNIPEELHYNAWIAERTNSLMEQFTQDGESFLLWASFFDPHPSYLVPEPWDQMYDPDQITVPLVSSDEHAFNPPHFKLTQEPEPDFTGYWEKDGHDQVQGFHSHLCDRDELAKDIAIYFGMVSCMDKYIGLILDRLDELGLAENTLVVFTSDHGHFFGQHGLIWKGPFHYEDMIRVPLIVSWPGVVPCGQRSSSLQSLVDLAPTLMNFADLEVPRTMTGVTQTDVWCGNTSSCRNHIIVEDRHQPTTVHVKTYVNERFKITVYFNQKYGELFDLQDDPGEHHNRWADPDYERIKSKLMLEFLHAEMGKEPLWMPRIERA